MTVSAENLIEKYNYFIFDCDGVLWDQDEPIEGAIDFVKYLTQQGKKVFFVTNSSWRGQIEVYEHFVKLGFEVGKGIEKENFYSATSAAVSYAKNTLGSKKIFVFGLKGVTEEVKRQGLEAVEPDDDYYTNSRCNEVEFEEMKADPTIDTLICGYTNTWTYKMLCYASILLRGMV